MCVYIYTHAYIYIYIKIISVSDTDKNAEERGTPVFKNRSYTEFYTRPEDYTAVENEGVLNERSSMSKNVNKSYAEYLPNVSLNSSSPCSSLLCARKADFYGQD